MGQTNSKTNNLAIGAVAAFCLAILGASIHAASINGFNAEILQDMSIFEFWQYTPFVQGSITHEFLDIGLTFLATFGVLMLGLCMLLFYNKEKYHGTAAWAKFNNLKRIGFLKPYNKITGPIFGKATSPKRAGAYLTNHHHPHSMVVAPTRAGKGVGVVIPTLLTFDGSVLALDVKGELWDETSRSRVARGDKVFKLCPLDPEGRTHCYNPVQDILKSPPDRRFLEARRLAANLIVSKGKGGEGFIDGARDLFVAGILYCIEKGNPTIGAVYDLFAMPGEKYKLFAKFAEESEIPEVVRIFDNMASNDTKIITSYTSVLGDGGLNLWADQLIKNATSRSDFSIYDLRRDPTSIFLVVSPNDLEVIAPLVRLFFQQIVSVMQRSMPDKDSGEIFEVLFLFDEFKHLGKMEAIETAITTIAGYGARFMFIIQSLAALTANYEQSGKENFLGNTGIQVFMATADDETPQYISKAIGERTFTSKSKTWSMKSMMDNSYQQSEQGSALIRPEQIRLLDDDTQIVLIKGQPPVKIPKVKYYMDKILAPLYTGQTGERPEPEQVVMEKSSMLTELELSEDPTALKPQDDSIDNEMPTFDYKLLLDNQVSSYTESAVDIGEKLEEIHELPETNTDEDFDEEGDSDGFMDVFGEPFEETEEPEYPRQMEKAENKFEPNQPLLNQNKKKTDMAKEVEMLEKIKAMQAKINEVA